MHYYNKYKSLKSFNFNKNNIYLKKIIPPGVQCTVEKQTEQQIRVNRPKQR